MAPLHEIFRINIRRNLDMVVFVFTDNFPRDLMQHFYILSFDQHLETEATSTVAAASALSMLKLATALWPSRTWMLASLTVLMAEAVTVSS